MTRIEAHQEPGVPTEDGELAKWSDHVVVHIVGTHLRMSGLVTILTDCGESIAVVPDRPGWYKGNTKTQVSCLLCLARSNFGTYAPR